MRWVTCALAAAMVVALSGCLTIGARFPVSMGDGMTGGQVAYSKAQNVIIVCFGDASISAALKDSHIKHVHCVDCEILNVLGIYAEYKTIVYGD